MNEKKTPPDDIELFRQAVGDVKPVKNDRVPLQRNDNRKPIVRQGLVDDRAVMDILLEELSETDFLETGEHLAYTRPGVQRSILKRLKSGRYAIQGEIDLHGLTVAEARIMLSEFLSDMQAQGKRCVRIIHGKGRRQPDSAPRLKQAVNQWLQRQDKVLAFCSARISDGGTGAVYVLLR